MPPAPSRTIDVVLEEFLADQREHLSLRTVRTYEEVVELLRDSLNGYAYEGLGEDDRRRFEQAFHSGDGEAFCRLFGPEHIVDHLGEFLGYFMVRKVIAGEGLLRAAGTVTKKLATWLYEQGDVAEEEAAEAAERGAAASRNLPRAERLASLLYEQSTPRFDSVALGEQDLVDDYLVITRVEAGALHFSGGIGPLEVGEEAAALAEIGWGVNISLARLNGAWQVAEVGNVYPR